jgi:serine/threonine protein kinase
MKVLDKQEIVNQRMTQNVLNERFILAALSYPLIVNLRCALQSPVDLFMIVDLMQGGDVRYHMRQDKRFTEERVKFYCAQTALALNFLHSQGYVHRCVSSRDGFR